MTFTNRLGTRHVATITVHYGLLMELLEPVLPRGVKVVAIRDDPFAGCVEFLLEGESLPEVIEGTVVFPYVAPKEAQCTSTR